VCRVPFSTEIFSQCLIHLFTRFCSSSPCTATFLTVTLSVYLYLSILAVAPNFFVFPCLGSLLMLSLSRFPPRFVLFCPS
jgi:hypothetical protein